MSNIEHRGKLRKSKRPYCPHCHKMIVGKQKLHIDSDAPRGNRTYHYNCAVRAGKTKRGNIVSPETGTSFTESGNSKIIVPNVNPKLLRISAGNENETQRHWDEDQNVFYIYRNKYPYLKEINGRVYRLRGFFQSDYTHDETVNEILKANKNLIKSPLAGFSGYEKTFEKNPFRYAGNLPTGRSGKELAGNIGGIWEPIKDESFFRSAQSAVKLAKKTKGESLSNIMNPNRLPKELKTGISKKSIKRLHL